jgi:RNA polymerase sigma factor (sigma-70 family)
MGMMTSAADHEWAGVIESAASGDDVAFGRLVAAYGDDMRRVCIVVCRDEALAEDAVQAAWAIAWQRLASLREPARIKPWLIAIAANRARDLLRDQRRRSEVEVRGRAPSVAGGVDPSTGIDSLDMLAAVERLDPQDRALLAMRYVAGFDAAELSLALGLSPAGTRTRLKRLIDRLKGELSHG